MSTQNRSGKIKKMIFILAALILFVAAIAFSIGAIGHKPDEAPRKTVTPPPKVSVIDVPATTVTASITARGEVISKYQSNLVSEVSARVISVSDSLATGKLVKSGELLAKLDDTEYRKELASAKSELATAEVTLLQEQRTASQAQKEWNRAKLPGNPDQFLLRIPQIKAAKAAVELAKAKLIWARQQLKNTQVRAPFNGVVISRAISPGNYVQAGGALFSLYSIDTVEIKLSLSAKQWKLTPWKTTSQVRKPHPVTLTNEDGNSWTGTIARIENYADTTTHQKALVVEVENLLKKGNLLVPGVFVSARFNGKLMEHVLEIPENSLTSQGQVWFVEDGNLLNYFNASPLYQTENRIYITAPKDQKQLKVLANPLSSYLPGTHVTLSMEKTHES